MGLVHYGICATGLLVECMNGLCFIEDLFEMNINPCDLKDYTKLVQQRVVKSTLYGLCTPWHYGGHTCIWDMSTLSAKYKVLRS